MDPVPISVIEERGLQMQFKTREIDREKTKMIHYILNNMNWLSTF